MSANLIIGSSHAINLAQAVGTFSATMDEAANRLLPIVSVRGGETRLLFIYPQPPFISFENTAAGSLRPTFGPPIDEIRTFNRDTAKVVFMVGGNEPSAFFFYRHPKPYDFVHPEIPHTDVGKQILPFSQMKAIVMGLMHPALRTTAVLAQQLPLAAKYALAPPPPIPADDHIRKFPEIFDFEQHGVEDPFVRLKIHRLQTQLIRDFCAAQGITFLPGPRAKSDDDGFLREEYWNHCTHATADYYSDLANELEL